MSRQKMIIDVETSGFDFDSLDEVSREQLTRYFERYAKDNEELEESKDKLGFWPLTGEIVAIGCLNPDSNKGVIYVQSSDKKLPTEVAPGIALERGTEAEILKKFWSAAEHYSTFITFNGRQFDAPFLMIRSAINEIRPSKNLLTNRYVSSQDWSAIHIDLADQLTFYGASRRNFSLHFWAKAFGFDSPKEAGVTGDDVKALYRAGKVLDIAKYNLGDLYATKSLYEKWSAYLNF